MPRPIITLTTDFGTDNAYVAQMKGVILSINPNAVLVDVTHDIPPQDIRQAALILADATPRFPSGSVHICVVDPGVGTERRIVCAEIAKQHYVAPDNGLLSYLTRNTQPTSAVAITNRSYWLPVVSSTFHGRDIMAPVAAHLSLGMNAKVLGQPAGELTPLDWPETVVEHGRITGAVIAKDSFGNLITNIQRDELSAMGSFESTVVCCGGRTVVGIVDTYGQRSPGSVIALFGSSERLEIAVVNGNAAKLLPIRIGDPVAVMGDGSQWGESRGGAR
jgi:S-adenosylmethionine hydrolase